MDRIRDALLRMYRLAKISQKFDKAFMEYDTPYAHIYGYAIDAIYALLGEHTETIEESTTYNVLNTVSLTEDRAVALLMNEYEKNTKMPAPHTFTREKMRDLYKKNGGYMTPEGDWK